MVISLSPSYRHIYLRFSRQVRFWNIWAFLQRFWLFASFLFFFSSKNVYLTDNPVFHVHHKTGQLQPHIHDWRKNHISLQKGFQRTTRWKSYQNLYQWTVDSIPLQVWRYVMYVNLKTSRASIVERVTVFFPMLASRRPCHSEKKKLLTEA